jgi:hypothetical protein
MEASETSNEKSNSGQSLGFGSRDVIAAKIFAAFLPIWRYSGTSKKIASPCINP